jgi:hypothetical protein
MNKFVNILLLLLMIPAMAVTIYVGFDLPVEFIKTTGENIPFKAEIFLIIAGLLLMVGARRSVRRWMGMRLVNQLPKFQWNEPMGESRMKQVNMYLVMEAGVSIFLGLSCWFVTHQSWPIVAVMVVLALDHLLFAVIGRQSHKFRVGVTSKAIVVADRDVKIIYFSGLRRVSTHQQSLFFDYIKELQLAIPIDAVSFENRTKFREAIEKNINRDKVYFSEGFKEF